MRTILKAANYSSGFCCEIRKFSTKWHRLDATIRECREDPEALALHDFAALFSSAVQETFHSLAGFSTTQEAILKSLFPLV
jgi:hypothetical protein